MCNIKSALVLKDKIYCPLDDDSHENMIEELKLRDDQIYRAPAFVRVEMIPVDNDIFNHKKSNWKFKVDQNNVPDWFDEVNASKEMWQYIKEWFGKRFIVDDLSNQERKNERLYLKNSSAVLRENSSAVMWGNSSAEMRENSSAELWENSSAVLRENSSAVLRENSSAVLRGNSSAVLWENSSAELRGNSSAVLWENSSAELRGNSSKIKSLNDNAIVRDFTGDEQKIIVANPRIKLVKFK
jgi:hypothetical protein